MSITAFFTPETSAKPAIVNNLNPGDIGIFFDLSQGVRRAIIMLSYGGPGGGEVFDCDYPAQPGDADYSPIRPAQLCAANYVTTIPPGGHYERPVLAESLVAGQLVLRHLFDQ